MIAIHGSSSEVEEKLFLYSIIDNFIQFTTILILKITIKGMQKNVLVAWTGQGDTKANII